MNRSVKLGLFGFQGILAAAVATGFGVLTYYAWTRLFESGRTAALVVAIALGAIVGGALGYGTYLSVRIHLFGDSQELWNRRLERAFRLNPNFLFWSLAPLLFSVFMVINSLGMLLLLLMIAWPLTRILPHLPGWMTDVVHAMSVIVWPLSMLANAVLSFFAVRWLWRQQHERSSSGVERKGSNA
jgi:hypothetical protein